jgi:hypothetical protein
MQPGITDPALLRDPREEAVLVVAVNPELFDVETIMPAKARMNLPCARRATVGSDLAELLATVTDLAWNHDRDGAPGAGAGRTGGGEG